MKTIIIANLLFLTACVHLESSHMKQIQVNENQQVMVICKQKTTWVIPLVIQDETCYRYDPASNTYKVVKTYEEDTHYHLPF